LQDRYQLFIYSLDKSADRLERALCLLDWSKGFKVSSFLKRHRQAVVNVVKKKHLQQEYDSLTYLYYLPKDEALKLEITLPEDFKLDNLSQEDALKANKVWPNKHEGSEFFLKRLAAWNPNVGLYDDKGVLVAWCFQLQAGPLGALQVDENHFQRGFGTIVAKAMAKKLAESGKDTFALVGQQNIPSQKMFEKIGFKHVDDAYWLRTLPTVDFHWTD
jgi:ribosomal protein S18 acetylase RimI-like enzyme